MRRRTLAALGAVLVVGACAPDVPTAELRSRYADHGSRFVRVDGMDVHVRDEGQGPVIVLVHGTSSSLHTWDAWAAALRDSFRVVRFDLPGFGLTGPSPAGDYRIPAYVDFVQHLLDTLHVPPAVVIGNSLGGEIAWHLALAAPGRVTRLVLVDPAGLPTGTAMPLPFRLARLPMAAPVFRHVTPRSLVERSLREVYHDPSRVADTLVDRYWAMARAPGNREAFVARANQVSMQDGERLRDIRVPTLVLWGDDDRWIPTRLAAEFGARIPGAIVRLVPQAGHVPMEERPQASLALVRPFLTGTAP